MCNGYLLWLFAAGIAAAIYRGFLPWEIVAAICHGVLPWEFTVAICRENLLWLFAVGLFCVCKQTSFLCEQIFLFCNQSFLIESKSFLYVSKTFLFMKISLSAVFLFVIAVAAMGHRTFGLRPQRQ